MNDTSILEALQRGDTATALGIADELDRMPPAPRASILGAALWYGERGLRVFPISPRSKKPYLDTHGLHDATSDAGRIRAAFETKPNANIAIATGHRVDVIDFDGLEAHLAWGRTYPTWAEAGIEPLAIVSTPRPGGMHVYVTATGEGNYAGMLPGVDYRGLGGYVVVPPSITAAGTYDFLQPLPEVLS
ncbi:bifunctional DNA primase/polymerase [Kribbella sp. NPDC058245]|uniref:bifunctional DNA primase/polymerase n=1 Tax=Kribbella sp. NPDC058245 TaxID=3346399 RepID=UPI0036F0AB30